MTYDELRADRGLFAQVLKAHSEAKSVSMLDLIKQLSDAEGLAILRHGPAPRAEAVLALAGVDAGAVSLARASLREAEHEAFALQAQVETPAPVGEQDGFGRFALGVGDAARVLDDPVVQSRRWLEAKQLGLEGSQDRAGWTQQDAAFARAGADMLKTLRGEKHAKDAQAAAFQARERELLTKRYDLDAKPTSRFAEAHADSLRMLQAAVARSQESKRETERSAPEPTREVPATIVSLDDDGRSAVACRPISLSAVNRRELSVDGVTTLGDGMRVFQGPSVPLNAATFAACGASA